MPPKQSIRYTKERLYREVSNFREYLGVLDGDYPLDAIALAKGGGLSVDHIPFKTRGLKGSLALVDNRGYIFLDPRSSKAEQNFFCAHESMHFILHRDIERSSFQCFDGAGIKRDSILEWQANEGAAEFLLPYKLFIPDLLNLFHPFYPERDIRAAIDALSSKYKVSEIVVKNRIEALKYETIQVADGTDINDVIIMSKSQQERRGIYVKSCYELGLDLLYADMVT